MLDGYQSQIFKQLTLDTDSKEGFPIIVKVRTIQENFRLKIEKYLRTANFKSILLVLIKKACRTNTTKASLIETKCLFSVTLSYYHQV